MRTVLLALATVVFGLPGAVRAQDAVTVYAAASTRDVVGQLAKTFQKETGTKVEVVPGPSSALARQIEQGAPADLFLSADQASADYLAGKKLLALRRTLLTNRLVVAVPADSKLSLESLADLTRVKRLALAEPKVPAGEYARQALAKAEVLESLKDKIIGGVDVRATLQYVTRGEVDAGIVYQTDAVGQSKIRVALEIPAGLHAPIEYPLAVIARDKVHPQTAKLYEFLQSEQAAEAFRAAQFGVAKESK